NADAHRAMVERVRREVPDFYLLTGDMVDDASHDSEWQTFFQVERELLRDNVAFPAVGNHDRQGRARTADTFRRLFSVPAASPDPSLPATPRPRAFFRPGPQRVPLRAARQGGGAGGGAGAPPRRPAGGPSLRRDAPPAVLGVDPRRSQRAARDLDAAVRALPRR